MRNIAGPILWIDSKLDHATERRIRPIPDPRHEFVLDRVDMDIIQMTREAVLIADGMLPVAPLPNSAFAFGGATARNPFTGGEAARERRFDQPPARGKIRVVVRQRPGRMEMIGQHDHRVDRESMMAPRLTKRSAQFVDMLR